mmetsp:Transcript_89902/g.254774  ORF Transcript_89902/g.254774 Transcript_89902/m.254774 type:complete len:222 (+) Transcript_89902:2576-3241(+)
MRHEALALRLPGATAATEEGGAGEDGNGRAFHGSKGEGLKREEGEGDRDEEERDRRRHGRQGVGHQFRGRGGVHQGCGPRVSGCDPRHNCRGIRSHRIRCGERLRQRHDGGGRAGTCCGRGTEGQGGEARGGHQGEEAAGAAAGAHRGDPQQPLQSFEGAGAAHLLRGEGPLRACSSPLHGFCPLGGHAAERARGVRGRGDAGRRGGRGEGARAPGAVRVD